MNRNDIIKTAQQQWKERLKPQGPIEIPEWPDADGKPAKVYFREMNVIARDWVLQVTSTKGPVQGACAVLIMTLCDDQGTRIFKREDLNDIATGFDPEVIDRIASRVKAAKAAGLEVEDMGKSSKRTRASRPASSSRKGSTKRSKK